MRCLLCMCSPESLLYFISGFPHFHAPSGRSSGQKVFNEPYAHVVANSLKLLVYIVWVLVFL